MTSGGLRERKKRETRAALQATTIRLARESSLRSVTIEQICAEVGVSRRTFFNYFATKEEAVFGWGADVEHAVARAVSGQPAGTSDLDAVVTVTLEVFRGALEGAEQAVHHELVRGDPDVLDAGLRHLDTLTHALARGLADRAGTTEPTLAARARAAAVTAVAVTAVRHWHRRRDRDEDDTDLGPVLAEAFRALDREG